jgi:ABC-type polysaccharide/polyol phosphate transport system ATPase subunit
MSQAETVISVQNVTKIYKLYDKPIDRLKESVHPFGKKYHKDFYALKDVTLEVKKGETVGIIGKNGSGKSTLLKIITGVLQPTSGNVRINGKLSALLELGAGFNPEFTGLENIYLHGTILGYSKEEMDKKLDDILSFADIGDFINQPVKIYSSGMFVRLAFAVSINVDPDILIVDEALSVGDMRFQQKCFRKIEEFKKSKTILFVSHDLATINNYCDRVVWINEGSVIADGEPLEISKQYRAFMSGSYISRYSEIESQPKISDSLADQIRPLDSNLDIFGDNKVKIEGIAMLDGETNSNITVAMAGQNIKLLIKARAYSKIDSPIFGFTIKDRVGNIVLQTNSYVLGQFIEELQQDEIVIGCFEFKLPHLNQGQYTISPAVASGTQDDHVQHCWVHDALIFQVINNENKYHLEGIITLQEVEFEKIV